MVEEHQTDWTNVKNRTRRRVSRAIKDLDNLEVSDLLEAQIVERLLEGRRTVTELVEEIYGHRKGDEGFMSAYSRTRRCIQHLESRGFVATKILGRDRPYRLTKYAVSRLADFDIKAEGARLVPRKDLVLYALGASLGCLSMAKALGQLELGGAASASIYGSFLFLTGVAVTRFVQTVCRVM